MSYQNIFNKFLEDTLNVMEQTDIRKINRIELIPILFAMKEWADVKKNTLPDFLRLKLENSINRFDTFLDPGNKLLS